MARRPAGTCAGLLGGILLLPTLAHAGAQVDYVADVEFAVAEIETRCAELLRGKAIDWRAVSAPLVAEAQAVREPAEHLRLLSRLLARLRDGHAEVQLTSATEGVAWPEDRRRVRTGAGMFWCRSGGKLYLKNVWSDAAQAGLSPGMELLEVDGIPAGHWLEQRTAELSDRWSFSSEQHAFFATCHQGLQDFPGTKRRLLVKKRQGKPSEREFVYRGSNPAPWGPAYPPADLEDVTGAGDVRFGLTQRKYGYLHLRRVPADLPEQVERALERLGNVKGLVLDLRGNSGFRGDPGGELDHEALMGRFVPQGKSFSSASEYASAGQHPYGGPIVAIVDGTVGSAAEIAAGLFKDDGRGYVIGESATAGASSRQTTIELPSGLFLLQVSIASNMGRYNGGKGLEGIGVVPHRIVEFDPEDLEAERDTQIRVAEELLARFPQKDVRYDPKDFGWKR